MFRDPFVKGRESTEFGRGFSNKVLMSAKEIGTSPTVEPEIPSS